MKDFQPGSTAPPFHVRCRSTTVPYFNDEFTVGEQRAARGENGEYYTVPADMKYEEWKKAFVDGGSKEGLKHDSDIEREKTNKNKQVELFRAIIPNRKTAIEGFKIVDKATYNRLTKKAIDKGANIQIATNEMLEHLNKNNARAVTIGDTIIFAPEISVSDLLEELYHFEQNRKGLYNQFGLLQRTIMCEIDAKKYLLSVEKRYKIPLEELDETRMTLKAYEKQKQDMIERGEWVDEN